MDTIVECSEKGYEDFSRMGARKEKGYEDFCRIGAKIERSKEGGRT